MYIILCCLWHDRSTTSTEVEFPSQLPWRPSTPMVESLVFTVVFCQPCSKVLSLVLVIQRPTPVSRVLAVCLSFNVVVCSLGCSRLQCMQIMTYCTCSEGKNQHRSGRLTIYFILWTLFSLTLGILTLLNNLEQTKEMNIGLKSGCASAAAATFRIVIMPIDTVKVRDKSGAVL